MFSSNQKVSQPRFFLKDKPPDILTKKSASSATLKKKKTSLLDSINFPTMNKKRPSTLPSGGAAGPSGESSNCTTEKTSKNQLLENADVSLDSEVLSAGCCPVTFSSDESESCEVDLAENYKQVVTQEIVTQEVDESRQNGSAFECGDHLSFSESVNIPNSRIIHTNRNRAAKLDLSKIIEPNNLPNQPVLKQIQITSADSKLGVLSKMNPFHIAREINEICGDVENIEHRRSGSLLIVTKSVEQAKLLLKIKTLSKKQIPVIVTPDWGQQTVQGKVFIPQFADDPLEDLLEMLKPQGVVGIRKMFHDPKRVESSLYVLTFLGQTCPNKIRVGYTSAYVDKYYPSPLRCGKCCRWGHSSQICHSGSVCSNCGGKGHIRNECKAALPRCINCRGAHDATSKECLKYINEKEICRVKVDEDISFREARIRVMSIQANVANKNTINQKPHSSNGNNVSQAPNNKKGKSNIPTISQLMRTPSSSRNR